MQFALTGFKQDTGFRVFAFECTAADRTRTEYTVRADLALTRKYGIQMQDLPLLCRGLLERHEGGLQHAITFTEEEMCLHAQTCREARNTALLKRKSARLPATTSQTGAGWRVRSQFDLEASALFPGINRIE